MPCISTLSLLRRQLTTFTHNLEYPSQQSLSLLQSCKSINELKQIHAQFIRSDQVSNTLLATKIVEFCAIFTRNIDYALRVFSQIKQPNAYTWTTMIRGFVQIKIPSKALEFYNLMRSQGVEPNKFTFIFVLKAYSLIPNYTEGRDVHGKLVKLGFCFDPFIRNALISLYSKCGDINAGYRLFSELSTGNVVNWNTMISGFLRCGYIEKARELFDEMPERNVESWNVLISGYLKMGHVEVARSLFDQMPKRELFSWSTMISGYVQSRKASKALELFKEMQDDGFKPDVVTLSSVLSACAQVGALDIGRWIHAYVGRNKLKHDVILGTSLVDMYAKCGCIDVALQVFNSILNKNVCTWNAIICGLAIHGYGANVLQMYKQMEAAHIQPNDVTFVGVLSACCHIGSVYESRRQFNRMKTEFGIMPKIEHYGCMVDILGRAGLISEAKDLIRSMPLEPNVVVLGAFLSACKLHNFTNVGDDIVRQLKKLALGDGGCYVLLSNIYADQKQWDKVAEMRKMLKVIGVEKKTPGCSFVEVNSIVHEFLVDDKLHPKWKEVYAITEKLNTHLELEEYVPNPSLLLYNIDVDRETHQWR